METGVAVRVHEDHCPVVGYCRCDRSGDRASLGWDENGLLVPDDVDDDAGLELAGGVGADGEQPLPVDQ